MKLIICPVCKKKFVEQGIKNHIINTAKGELWRGQKNKPHKEYYDNNQIIINKKILRV